MAETTLWETSPSQWLNIWHFSGSAVLTIIIATVGIIFSPLIWLLVIPIIGWVVWRGLVVRCQRYKLTTERIHVQVGVLNQKIDEIELYRVKDITMTRSLWMRMTGLASIHLKTSDRTLSKLDIPAIRQGDELREKLRKQVEVIRDNKRVREMDFSDTHSDFGDDSDFDEMDLDG